MLQINQSTFSSCCLAHGGVQQHNKTRAHFIKEAQLEQIDCRGQQRRTRDRAARNGKLREGILWHKCILLEFVRSEVGNVDFPEQLKSIICISASINLHLATNPNTRIKQQLIYDLLQIQQRTPNYVYVHMSKYENVVLS